MRLQNTEDTAQRLGVRGWCMNTRDGTVKGVIEGEQKPFAEMYFRTFLCDLRSFTELFQYFRRHWLTNVGSSQSRIDKAVFSEIKTSTDYSFPEFGIRRVPKK